MAVTGYKVYVVDNYFYIDEIVDSGDAKRYEGLAKDVLVRTLLVDSTSYAFTGVNGFTQNEIAFNLLFDENGDAWADQATFEAWYRAELGKSSGGGSSSNTSLITDITYIVSDGSSSYTVGDVNVISVFNRTQGIKYYREGAGAVAETVWNQDGLGAELEFIGTAPDVDDEIEVTYGYYADVTPPTMLEAVIYVSQGNIDPPTITQTAINTVGAITTGYESAGIYTLQRSGGFPQFKTFVITGYDVNGNLLRYEVNADGKIYLFISGLEDDALNNTPIKIEIYN